MNFWHVFGALLASIAHRRRHFVSQQILTLSSSVWPAGVSLADQGIGAELGYSFKVNDVINAFASSILKANAQDVVHPTRSLSHTIPTIPPEARKY